MKLNNFDCITGIYTHTTFAIRNPRGDGFFEQAHSTPEPLPKLELHEVAVRSEDGTEWLTIEDYRGSAWSTDTKSEVKVLEIGPLPEGLTTIEPKKFDRWNGSKWVRDTAAELNHQISKARMTARILIDEELSKPVSLNGALFDYTQQAKASILETIEEAQILGVNDSESTGWRLQDNSIRETSVFDLKEIVKIGAVRRREVNHQYSLWTQGNMSIPFEIT
jgi:hypothetical protein